MRLIDADALKKYVDGCEFCNNCQNKKNRCAFDCVLPDYLTSEWERVIDEQPTVDAVQVVRCAECNHYHDDDDPPYCDELCTIHVEKTDGCLRGIKRGAEVGYRAEDGERRMDGEADHV